MAPTLGTGVSSLPPGRALAALGRPGGGAVAPTLGTGVSSLPPGGALAALGRPGGGSVAGCVLCAEAGGRLVFAGAKLRVIHAQEAGFPGFYRVVWQDHVAEFSDLSVADRALCMNAVVAVERALRVHLQPDKINLAALGNMVPHLHWHVIARFAWDTHFPAPVWASAQRASDGGAEGAVRLLLPAAEAAMLAELH